MNNNVIKINEMNDESFSAFIENEINPIIHSHSPEIDVIALRNRYPHLQTLCDYFERCIALTSLREDKKLSLPSPLILLGEPGCGKTDFALHITQQLHAEVSLFDCSCASAGFLLTGMSSSWRGGKRGIIYELAYDCGINNKPFLILDEIDKAVGSSQHPILPTLGGLFEPSTAAKFTDEFNGEGVDANAINYICTANSLEGIPEHILDRCEIICCPSPDREQRAHVVNSVWNDLKVDIEADGFELDHDVIPVLCEPESSLSLRIIKRALVHAVAVAVMGGRTKVSCDDVMFVMSAQNLPSRNTIGFI